MNGNVTENYIYPILSDDEYEEIISDFERNDEIFESIVNKTADFKQLRQDRMNQIEACLFGGTSSEAIDGFIQWIKSPDCDKGDLLRLREAIDKWID